MTPEMPADLTQTQLLSLGLDVLRQVLPEDWTVQERPPQQQSVLAEDESDGDVVVDIVAPALGAEMVLVTARTSLLPAEAVRVLAPKLSLLQRIYSSSSALVIAPWLSRRSRQVLTERHIGYLDLTGNINIRISRPPIVILTQGSRQDPRPRPTWQRKLSGHKAARLVRLLADVSPPYLAKDLTERAGVSQSYASRLLEVMEQQAFITREGRRITNVDWQGLLRARAAEYRLLDANPSVTMVAPTGLSGVIDRLRTSASLRKSVAVTGSVAVAAVAPTAVSDQLMLYVPPGIHAPDNIGDELRLIRSDHGEVVLMRSANDIVFAGTRQVSGVQHVALSQLALDCLAGPGRMPVEGEAVLEYMRANEPKWRAPTLDRLRW